MNNIVGNFTGMNGRLNRQAWWIGVVILIIAGFILTWVIGLVMGTGGISFDQALDPAAMQRTAWQGLIVSIITAYPYIALSVKRRHDRDNNGYDAIGLIVVGIIYNLLQALGVITPFDTVGGAVSIVFAIYAIYMLVQLGFLKGTAGANSYGADPLGG